MIFISLYANQLDNKSLRRRCDSLNGITCECANPLADWSNECSYLLWEYNNRKICYVPVIKYFKRTVSYSAKKEMKK
ncbi:Uncharacterized protein BM_BM18107 [Brugia malayi]|uniref:Uncharacterized protein n=1 Tax=Brugia malayi TaxID=6279 RepID=A0A4E9FFY6_BRUMA|nr:Uncharacterized protein BM_BM18107 [Brugia malayi]VIO95777.1 Uncharacterized protein BM_BM18107 [Brugia malayi]